MTVNFYMETGVQYSNIDPLLLVKPTLAVHYNEGAQVCNMYGSWFMKQEVGNCFLVVVLFVHKGYCSRDIRLIRHMSEYELSRRVMKCVDAFFLLRFVCTPEL